MSVVTSIQYISDVLVSYLVCFVCCVCYCCVYHMNDLCVVCVVCVCYVLYDWRIIITLHSVQVMVFPMNCSQCRNMLSWIENASQLGKDDRVQVHDQVI